VINDQVKAAARKPAAAAPVQPDVVADALLPPVATLSAQMPKARQALDERFNVSFNNVPVQQFFNSMVAGTRYNMLVDPKLTDSITANLKDVTLVEALEAMREMYGYDYKIDGSRIYIKPAAMQTRMFHINYLIGKRRGASNLNVTSTSVSNSANNGSGSNNNNTNTNTNTNANNGNNQNNGAQGNVQGSNTQGNSSSVQTSSASDFWTEMTQAIETIVGKEGGRSVVISPQSGVVVIRAMPDEIRNVEMYLKATQLSVDRQVILEAKILEVELNDSFQSGINWASFASFSSSHQNRVSTGFLAPGTTLAPLPFAGGQPPVISTGATGLAASAGFSLASPSAAAGSLFGFALQTSNFTALISFLESQGTVHVLSSPRIATLNNQKALLKIGTDEFFVTGVTSTTATSSAGNTTTPSVTTQPFFSGVVLDVTPQIDDRGNIILHVHPSVSQVSTVVKGVDLGSSAGTVTLPLASSSTSEMDSVVRGQDGRVVAIGGLMRQSSTADNSQLPGVGEVPLLGALFRNKSQVNQKRELVVLIKPTIVDGPNVWNDDLLDASRRFQDLAPPRPGRN
jgi:MSHA biogenesis protein MshL